MKSLIILFCLFSRLTHAGVLSSEPPKEFLNLPVTCVYCGGNWFSLESMLKYGFSPQAKQSWDKIDESQWLLKIVVDDKVSGNRTKFNILFVKTEGVANVSRINVNGEEASPAVFPNMLAPMRDAVWAKVGSPKADPAPTKAKATKTTVKSNAGATKVAETARLAEQKKEEDAIKTKLTALIGKYENVQGADDGEMEVSAAGESSVKINYSKKDGDCSIKDKTIVLNYLSYAQETFEGNVVDADCTIVINQMGYISDLQKYYLSLDSEGSCSKLCKVPGGIITGRFVKK